MPMVNFDGQFQPFTPAVAAGRSRDYGARRRRRMAEWIRSIRMTNKRNFQGKQG
jgi:hypothetical protein